MEKIVEQGMPVSYTHLLLLALLLNQKNIPGLPFFRTAFYLPSLVPVVASVMLLTWLSVSYTHLDVYKRQRSGSMRQQKYWDTAAFRRFSGLFYPRSSSGCFRQ